MQTGYLMFKPLDCMLIVGCSNGQVDISDHWLECSLKEYQDVA